MSWRKILKCSFLSSPCHKPASSEVYVGLHRLVASDAPCPHTNQPERNKESGHLANNVDTPHQPQPSPNSCFFLLVVFFPLCPKRIQYESPVTHSLGLSTDEKRCERWGKDGANDSSPPVWAAWGHPRLLVVGWEGMELLPGLLATWRGWMLLDGFVFAPWLSLS